LRKMMNRMTVDRAKKICDAYHITLKRREVVGEEYCCGIGLYLLDSIKNKKKATAIATILCGISNRMHDFNFALYEFASIGEVSPEYMLGLNNGFEGTEANTADSPDYDAGLEDGKTLAEYAGYTG
jgi:hypothetical protein